MSTNLDEAVYAAQDYGSEFENDSDVDRIRKRRSDLAQPQPVKKSKLPSKLEVTTEYNKDEGIKDRYHVLSLDAGPEPGLGDGSKRRERYARHKKYINDYLRYYGGSEKDFERDTSKDRTDHDVIRENHRFLWTEEDQPEENWEKSLSKQYYDKLFKEYCIADLSRYKENKIAMRWRIEKEVISGKGQFICGHKKCESGEALRSWEVNFGYVEHGEKKNALIKLRLCADCSRKLNYHHRRKEIKKTKKMKEVEKQPTTENSHNSESKQHKKHKKHKKHRDRDSERDSHDSDDKTKQDNSKSSAGKDDQPSTSTGNESAIWSGPVKISEEKSREDEFEDYFEDMFL